MSLDFQFLLRNGTNSSLYFSQDGKCLARPRMGPAPLTISPQLLLPPGPRGREPVTTERGAGSAVVPELGLLLWVLWAHPGWCVTLL